VSFGDDGFCLYVDGKQVAQSDYTGGIGNNKEQLVLGANAMSSSDGAADKLYEFFHGTITKVAAYGTSAAPQPAPQPAPAPQPGPDTSWTLDANLNGKNQKVVLDHDPSLELGDGSIVIDFTANDVSGWQTLLSKDSYGFDDGGHLTIRLFDRQVAARLESGDATYKLFSAGNAISPGKAHQVGVSFGDDGFCLYVDGKQVAQSDYTGGIGNNKEPLVLGANAMSSSDGAADKLYEFFHGTITQLTIDDQPLDADAGIFLA
jgi:hypothetical protein